MFECIRGNSLSMGVFSFIMVKFGVIDMFDTRAMVLIIKALLASL